MKKIVRTIIFRRNFRLRVQFNPELNEKFYQQVLLFVDGDIKATRPHALRGSMQGLHSFSITPDVRVIYLENNDYYFFLDIGTHQQIYRK